MDAITNVQNQYRQQTTETKQPNQDILEEIESQKQFLLRLIKLNKQKIDSLEKEVAQLQQTNKKNQDFIEKIKDKDVVARSREALHNRVDKDPIDKPIDRNGVAPKDVQIQNIFYAGRR